MLMLMLMVNLRKAKVMLNQPVQTHVVFIIRAWKLFVI